MSDSDITAESWWDREIVTAELDWLADNLAVRLGVARSEIGTKGNTAHRRGHHRSQEWILKSAYCTNRTYTVQTGLTATQARHIAAVDITPGEWGTAANRRKVAAITARVIAAMKAGELDEVLEVYGAAADLRTVTGYNNPENRAASSDDSHLDHVHLGFDRRHLTNRALMERVLAIVMGDDMADYGTFGKPALIGTRTPDLMIAELWTETHLGCGAFGKPTRGVLPRLDQVDVTLAAILAAVRGDDDAAAIIDGVKAQLIEQLTAQRQLLVADILAAVPDGPVSREDLVAALTQVLGSVDGASPPAQG